MGIFTIFVLISLLFSCASSGNVGGGKGLTMTFAGDIMAHTTNWAMKDYDMIYDDIRGILKKSDLSFANFETPVDERKKYETYPCFNVKPPYAEAAIRAGFNVFTLANNHSIDQGTASLHSTRDFFASKKNIYSGGLKKSADEPLTPILIRKKGFDLLCLCVTELSNAYTNALNFVNYGPKKQSVRNAFLAQIAEMRKKNPCDIFVLAIHLDEPEYILTVNGERKRFFNQLLAAGVDVIWASHPHVMHPWEVRDEGSKLVMYSMGNLISGQRAVLNYENPLAPREYTGDAYMLQVTATKRDGKVKFSKVDPILVTNYMDRDDNMTIRRFTEDFIADLPTEKERSYYKRRLSAMKDIHP